jgi:hypothetical protein
VRENSSTRLTETEKQALLAQNCQWRTVVEQVVYYLSRTKDPQALQLTVWLMHWLSEPQNVRRSLTMTIGQIIEIGRRIVGEPA